MPRRRVITSPPRLVHLTTTDMSLDWLLRPQLEAFAAAGYEVVGMSAAGRHVPSLAASGIRHVDVPALSRSPGTLGDLRAFVHLVRLLRAERPAVLHTHNPKPGVLGRIAGRVARVPVVVNTQHGLYAQPGDRRVRRWLVYTAERVAAAFSDAELVQNPEDAATLVETLRVPRRKVTVLGNGIDLSRFGPPLPDARARLRSEWGMSGSDVVVGAVGRLVREKGMDDLRAAAGRLRSGAKVVVIGPAEPGKPDAMDAEWLSTAPAAGLKLLGARDDMPDCYAAMDLFVTATHREGFPRAAMEAAAMGLPVVATDIRGCRQVVEHGVTGVLAAPHAPAELAAAIDELAVDPARRAKMAQAAQAKAIAEFDQQRVIRTTLDTYARLLRDRAGVEPPTASRR
jgi:glycosyltransferase involved in cell wall biosynthesis